MPNAEKTKEQLAAELEEARSLFASCESSSQQMRYLASIVESSEDAIIGKADDGIIISWNKGAERIYQYTEEEVLGKHVSLLVPDDRKEELPMILGRVRSGERVNNFETVRKAKDGRLIDVSLAVSPVLNQEGNIVGSSTIARDITERKRAEEALRLAKEEAEAANQAKSEFLANMSHELRTPMNGIIGMVDLALMTSTDPKVIAYLQIAKQSGKALLDIINDILDLSKIESGKVGLVKKPFPLRAGLESMFGAFAVSAHGKGLNFFQAIDLAVPDNLMGDLGRLRQVLTNLIGNAIKFSDNGTVRVSVEVDRKTAPAPGPGAVRLLFKVKDDGIGIAKERLAEVFEAFNQGDLSSHAQYGGTGLGLSISKNLVAMMHGEIWADSAPSKGSSFYFTALFGLAKGRNRPNARDWPRAVPVRELRILLAEDDRINRLLGVELLTRRGHRVEVAGNGREVLEKLKAGKFDLVLMDVNMPGITGTEAVRAIRTGEAGQGQDKAGIPVVALTAHALTGDRERFLAAGMDGYLAKPINLEELDRMLEEIGR